MAIIGFITCCLLLSWFSLAWLLAAFNTLGKYNIGGVPNTVKDRILTLVLLCIVIFFWCLLFDAAPFSVTLGGKT